MSSEDPDYSSTTTQAIQNCTKGLIEKVKTPAADARTGNVSQLFTSPVILQLRL